jgi:hypothetical protein
MSESQHPVYLLDELTDALDTLQNVGATGLISFAGYKFNINDNSSNEREKHPGTNSPYVRILGEKEGVPSGTPVITREDFYNFVHDFHSSDIESPTGYKGRAGNAWSYQATFENHERGRVSWSVWSDELRTILGLDPQKVIDFFAPYEAAAAVPTEGLALGPVPVKLWYSFAQYLATNYSQESTLS